MDFDDDRAVAPIKKCLTLEMLKEFIVIRTVFLLCHFINFNIKEQNEYQSYAAGPSSTLHLAHEKEGDEKKRDADSSRRKNSFNHTNKHSSPTLANYNKIKNIN